MARKTSSQGLDRDTGPSRDRPTEPWEQRSEHELEKVSREVMLGILRSLDASSFRVEVGSDGGFYCTFFEGLLADELGLTTMEIYGQPVEKVFPEQVHNELQSRLEKVLRGEPQEWIVEYKGRHYEFKLPAAGLLKKGSVVGSVADVTYRITSDASKDELLQRLEQARRETEQLNYTLSHDLRSPLTIIFSMCQVAEQELERGKGDLAKRLRMIRQAANRINEMLTDILRLSRVERIQPKRKEVDASAMAEEILRELGSSEPEREVETWVQPGISIFAEPVLARYMLENLLSNAWKYTGKEREPRIEMVTEEKDGQDWVCVRDNGIGFDLEEKERLFRPFDRLESAKGFPGTGVGLATVKRIVERHEGHVDAWGRPGEGAMFCFWLPSEASTHSEDRRLPYQGPS